MPHPPYSFDLTCKRLFVCLFHWMKKVLKGKIFGYMEEVKQKTVEALKGINTDQFKNCLEQWGKSLDRCIASNGEYFEGDWSLNM